MTRNISIYVCSFDLQHNEDDKLCHNATLGIKEDEKYDLSKEKLKTSAKLFSAYLYLTLNKFTCFVIDSYLQQNK